MDLEIIRIEEKIYEIKFRNIRRARGSEDMIPKEFEINYGIFRKI